jgi:hypothetical protein
MLQKIFIVSFLFIICSCSGPSDYSQSFIVLVNNAKVGTLMTVEKIDRKGNLTCLSEQERGAEGSTEKKRTGNRTKMVIPKGQFFPSTYSSEFIDGISYDIKVENGQIIRTFVRQGKSERSQIPFEPGMAMLDLSILHTIEYWFRNYDLSKGETQTIKTCLLPSGRVENLIISPVKSITPDNIFEYQISHGSDIKISLWVNKENRLVRMNIEGINIGVIRSDLYDKKE